jgi:hypothetical protein
MVKDLDAILISFGADEGVYGKKMGMNATLPS